MAVLILIFFSEIQNVSSFPLRWSLSTYVTINKKCLFFQAGIGLSQNFSTSLPLLLDLRPKATYLTTCYVALIHRVMPFTILSLVSSPRTFESLNCQNDFKRKVFFNMNNMLRGLSICSTCFWTYSRPWSLAPASPGWPNLNRNPPVTSSISSPHGSPVCLS